MYATLIEISEITLVCGVCLSNRNLKTEAKVMKRIRTNITLKSKVILVHACKWRKGITPFIHNVSTRWRWRTSRHGHFIPGKEPRYSQDRRWGGSERRPGGFGDYK
jgi:hypothetical protein